MSGFFEKLDYEVARYLELYGYIPDVIVINPESKKDIDNEPSSSKKINSVKQDGKFMYINGMQVIEDEYSEIGAIKVMYIGRQKVTI